MPHKCGVYHLYYALLIFFAQMSFMSQNPFEVIENRLANIETALIDLKKIKGELTAPSEHVEDIGNITLAEKITGLAKPTLYALVAQKKIPCMKKGKRLYFSRLELVNWIRSGRRKTTAERSLEAHNYLARPKGKKK
jgi:hypothetical protein